MVKNNGWMDFSNPLVHGFKKFMYNLLGPERYAPHEQTIEQLARIVLSERDYENLGKLIAEVFEAGFMRSIDEQKAELNRLGLKITLKTEQKPEGEPIFNQKNPSGSQ